jgi:hypothetical protein
VVFGRVFFPEYATLSTGEPGASIVLFRAISKAITKASLRSTLFLFTRNMRLGSGYIPHPSKTGERSMQRTALRLTFAVIIGIVVVVVGSQDLAAQPLGLGETMISTGGDLELEILPVDAAFTSEIRLVLPSGTFPIATSHEVGRVVCLEPAPAGVELIFEIFVQETGQTFRTGPGERNPDGLAHATVVPLGPSTWTVGFEDLAGGGDFDFNDVLFQVRPHESVCIVQLTSSAEVLGMLVNHPTNFTLAVAIPSAQHTNVPVPCQALEAIALEVANQAASEVSIGVEVFTHQGASLCTRGPFTLSEHGASEVVFGSDCLPH